MSDRWLRLAVMVVRGWARVYTCGLESGACQRRREEIDSDLWDEAHDTGRDSEAKAFAILTRLIRGVPDDLRWRIEMTTFTRVAFRSVMAAAALSLAAFVWINQSLRPPALPQAPPAPPLEILTLANRKPPVPPPPPPMNRKGMRDPDWAGLLMQIRDSARRKATGTLQ
jgi:hypothetical protein